MKKHLLLKTTSAAVITATAFCAFGAPVHAQETEEAEARQQTVIVSATRRDESVQDIPINIAAVGGEQIQQQGFSEIQDIVAYVPGITVVDGGARQGNPIIVRGINADPVTFGDGNNSGNGTVATYLGEIPIFIDLKLNDLQRVEVLLGPQGTLYGAGTLGGAIRYIPNKPDFAADMLEVRGGAWQYSEADSLSYETGVTFNKAFGDRFAVRGSLDFLDNSGYVDQPFLVQEIGVSDPDPDFSDPADVAANLRREDDINSEEAISGRLAARWQPVDWLDGTLTYYFQFQDIGGRTLSSQRGFAPAGEYDNAQRVPEPIERNNELLALELTADLGFAELTSATGYGKFDSDGQRDQTDLLISLEYSYEAFPSFTAFTRELVEDEFLNQELRLVSTTDTWFNWIVGAYYNEAEFVSSSSEYVPGFVPYVNSNFNFGLTDRPDALEYFSTSNTKLVEKAVFGEVGVDIGERLSVTVGGRFYEYELESVSTVDFPLFEPLSYMPLSISEIRALPYDPDLYQSDDGFLYKVNIDYDLTDDVLAYFTVSEGYRIGGSNGLGPCPAFDPNATQGACALAPGQQYGPNPGDIAQFDERQFGPDTTTNYELGLKSQWWDGTLTLNGAVFYVEWTDPQLSSATVNANIPITINANGAESKGVELSGDWVIEENFNIRAIYSFTQAELSEDVPFLVRTITPPGFGTAFEDGFAGDRLPGSPEHKFALFTSLDQPLANGNMLQYNFGFSYQGDVLTRTGGRGNAPTLDSYVKADASIVYDAEAWSATLFVNNIFDEYIETSIRGTSLSNQAPNGASVRTYSASIQPPRSIGVRFNYRFGG